jgi:hypothetical protein
MEEFSMTELHNYEPIISFIKLDRGGGDFHGFGQFVKTSPFISLCILRDLHQQKIPREL